MELQHHGTQEKNVIIKAENLGITNFNLVEDLKEYFNYQKVFLRNDAKCAAICEKKYGSLKKFDDAVFICLGTGVGGAVFLDGKLLKSKKYDGFELGHVILEKNGKQCTCGSKGCVETYISMKAFKESFAHKKGLKDISGVEVYDAIKNNNGEFDEIINEFIENLKLSLTTYINIFEPEAICIGGSFVYYEDLLLEKLVSSMKDNNITFNKSNPKILVAKMRKLCWNNRRNNIRLINIFKKY